jgi:hypothetical protein
MLTRRMWCRTLLCKIQDRNRYLRNAPKKRTMNFKDLIQSLLVYVGIPAVTLYPLGFAALAIQLWSDPLFPYYDFDTVWYAVTLIPKTQVVGTALKLIFLSLVATALGVGIALWVSRSLGRRRGLSVEERLEGRRRGLWAIYLLILLPLAVFITLNGVIIDTWGDVIALAGFFVLSVGVGVVVGYMRARAYENLFPTGLAVAYVGAVFAALCLAAINPPSLPLVRIDAQAGLTPSCTKMSDKTFVLLAAGSSYWHVFNKEGLYAVPSERLMLVQYQHCPWYQTRGIEPSVDF